MCCHRKPREEKAWDGQEVEDYPQKESASKHPYFLNPTTGRVEHSLATCWTSQDYTQIPGWCKFEISHCKHPPKLYQLHPILPHPLVAQRALRSPRDRPDISMWVKTCYYLCCRCLSWRSRDFFQFIMYIRVCCDISFVVLLPNRISIFLHHVVSQHRNASSQNWRSHRTGFRVTCCLLFDGYVAFLSEGSTISSTCWEML